MDRQEILRFLRQQPIINSWPQSEIEKLAGEMDDVSYPAEKEVTPPEYQAEDAYIVYSGKLRQSIFTTEGRERSFRTFNPRDVLLQQTLYRVEEYGSKTYAVEDSVLLRIPAPVFSDLLGKHGDLWSVIQNPAAARLQAIPLLRVLDDDPIRQLAVVTEAKEFKAGDKISAGDDSGGFLWIIDWGQVKITGQGEVGFFGGSRLQVGNPSAAALYNQGFPSLPHIVTAGNWFVTGPVSLPTMSVEAEALTNAKLIRIPGHVAEQLALGTADSEQLSQDVSDIDYMLSHRPDVAARLQQALAGQELFADLKDRHWQQLAGIVAWEHVPANLDVTRQGQYGTKLYVLSEGKALVRATDEQGRERPRHMIEVGRGDTYGTVALLHGDRHSATVRSLVGTTHDGHPLDGSDWLTLQKDDVRYVLTTNRDLWQRTALWHGMMEQPKQKKYRWQEDEEEIVLVTRRHQIWLWQRLIGTFLFAFTVAGLVQLAGSLLAGSDFSLWTPAIILLVLSIPLSLWFLNDYLNDYYVITSERVVRHERVVLTYENQLEAPLERIQEITTRTSLIAKIFNYGWMTIGTAGVGTISFPMIPDPEAVEATIRSLQGAVRAGTQAEQRENLRNKILSGLKLRLIPSIPARSLPEGTKIPVQLTPLESFMNSVTRPLRRFWRWLRRLPENIYLAFLGLLPKHARERTLKERQARARKRAAQMQDKVVYRKHGWFLIRAAAIPLAVIALTAILVVFADLRIHSLPVVIRIPYFVFLGVCIFWLWYRIENWRNDMYILTKTHIFDIYALPLGLFERRRQAEWNKVQNANYEVPNFWANLLNFGTVKVETASVDGEIDFINIPNPRKVQQEIILRIGEARQAAEQRERERRQSDLSETLEIYDELLKEWSRRNQMVGAQNPPGGPNGPTPPPPNS